MIFFNKNPKVEINVQELKEKAEKYYRDGDFYCSEALLKTIKDGFDAPYGDEIIKLASGFPVGMSNGCTCGAVSAGVMALGMFFGREKAKGKEVDKTMKLAKELQETFTQRNKVCCCKILTKGMKLGTPVHMEQCIRLTGEVTEMTAKIIARELKYKIV